MTSLPDGTMDHTDLELDFSQAEIERLISMSEPAPLERENQIQWQWAGSLVPGPTSRDEAWFEPPCTENVLEKNRFEEEIKPWSKPRFAPFFFPRRKLTNCFQEPPWMILRAGTQRHLLVITILLVPYTYAIEWTDCLTAFFFHLAVPSSSSSENTSNVTPSKSKNFPLSPQLSGAHLVASSR